MSIGSLIAVGAVVYFVIRFVLMPIVKRDRFHKTILSEIKAKAVEAALTTAAAIALLFSISAALAYGLIYYLKNLKDSTLEESEDSLEFVRAIGRGIESINGHIGLIVLAACSLAMIFWSYRRTRIKNQEQYNADISMEMEKLHEQFLAGELPELPPSNEILEVTSHIDEAQKEIDLLRDDPNKVEDLVAKQEYIQKLYEVRHSIDLLRRAEINLVDDIDKSQSNKDSSRWVTFFTSEGFFNTLGFGGKVLAILAILAIVPSSLVLTGPQLLSTTDEQAIALENTVREYQFSIVTGEVNQAYELLTSENLESDISDEDFELIQQVSQGFESEFFEDSLSPTGVGSQLAGTTLRAALRESTRSNILSRSVTRSGNILSLSSSAQTGGSASARIAEVEKALVRSAAGKPTTFVGRAMSGNLEDIARSKPKLWAELKPNFKKYTNSFSRSASPVRIVGVAVNQAIGDAVGSVAPKSSLFLRSLTNFGAEVSADTARLYTETGLKKFLLDFHETGDFVKSARGAGGVSKLAFTPQQVSGLRQLAQSMPSSDALSNHLQTSRAGLSASNPRVNGVAVENALSRRGVRSMSQMSALASFDDYFPAHVGQEFKTAQANTARALGVSNAPPRFSAATQVQLERSKRIAARSNSFIRLRGFSRVGGVLIGREPSLEETIVINDFSWTIQNGQFWFEIAANGEPVKVFGPYNPAIVNLALAYAADGRATTVTMVSADPMKELKILLHPSLIDTGLGCRARRLDQFADAAGPEGSLLKQLRNAETMDAIGEVQLYNLARNLQFIANSEHEEGRALLMQEDILSWVGYAKDYVDSSNLQYFAAASQRLADKSTKYIIASKPEYFLTSTTNLVTACKNEADLSSFKSCVSKAAVPMAQSTIRDGDGWLAHAVEFETWSGVREKEYVVDDSFDFMKTGYPNDLGPFRFMVQLAISSPAYFANTEKEWHESDNFAIDEYTDPNPWEFKSIEAKLNSEVLADIRNSSEKQSLYEDMIEFTLLQRFFRAALDGNMSNSFPFEKLVEVSESTETYVNNDAPTLRWNANPGHIEYEIYQLLGRTGSRDTPVLTCMNHIENLSNASNIDEINSLPGWQSACDEAAISLSLSPTDADAFQNLSNLMELRISLGVQIDDFLVVDYAENGCPRP